MMYYILEGKTPIETDLVTWGDWFEKAERHVDFTEIEGKEISTVFLGLDHGYYPGKPLLFETMVFGVGGHNEEYCMRGSTWKEAEEMHKEAIKWVEEGCKDE